MQQQRTTREAAITVRLETFLKTMRERTPRSPFLEIPAAELDLSRFGKLDGEIVPRAVITLRSVGCNWTRLSGGCTMCGHYAGACSETSFPPEHLVHQFEDVFRSVDWSGFPILCLYNGGSVLNREELPDEARMRILERIQSEKRIRELVLETRSEFIREDRLRELRAMLGDRRLTLAMGLESARDDVLRFSIHKGYSVRKFREACRIIKKYADLRLYVLVKPPWLTEREAIEDGVNAIRLAAELGADEIHIEPVTIQHHTLVHRLWKLGRYRLPWLWSLVEILCRSNPIPVYVSPFAHVPRPVAIPHNCGECDARLMKALLQEYNRTFDCGVFREIECPCRIHWRRDLDRSDERSLSERLLADLPDLENSLREDPGRRGVWEKTGG